MRGSARTRGWLGMAAACPLALLTACGPVDPGTDASTLDVARVDAARDSGPDTWDGVCAPAEPLADPRAGDRSRCTFTAGAAAVDTLGLTEAARTNLPITHVIVVMQENRGFDHYFGTLSQNGGPQVEGIPAGYTNPDRNGTAVAPFHLDRTCIPYDPPHQWSAMHAMWNDGRMDGFIRNAAVGGSDGRYALGYYDGRDLPFYHWLAREFVMADHYFGSSLGGTWSNRAFLYAGSAYGLHSTGEFRLTDVPTLFDALDARGVAWGSYTDGEPRQDLFGWNRSHRGVYGMAAFHRALADGTLPPVAFVDPAEGHDEHPPGDVQKGEAWTRQIYLETVASPLWPRVALFFTYDESGGYFDHLPPPPACLPDSSQTEFDRLGIRVPAFVISPWARGRYVSHAVHDHTSVLRFIELLHQIPAFSARDANADALLDAFDFSCPAHLTPPPPPPAGTGGCP